MSIHSAPRKMTYQDLRKLPEDLLRHELIDGEHIVSPAPLLKHQRVVLNVATVISACVRPRRLGEVFVAPVDVFFSKHDVVEPDVLFVAAANAYRLQKHKVAGAPDLVVEVVSPSSRRIDGVRKLRLYEAHGVREYWLADPETDVLEVYRLSAEGRLVLAVSLSLAAADVLETPLLPGLRIPLREIFG
jgi:Uma2 family endonuclease